MSTVATFCSACTVSEVGPCILPVARARDWRSARACVISGEEMSRALTTTVAGEGLPGKASWIRCEVATRALPLGSCCWKVRLAVCMVSVGEAIASRAAVASTAAASGRRSTGVSTAFQNRLPSPAPRRRRCRNGTLPFSTRSPSIESSAGSTVSEPSTAVITTRMVAKDIALKVAMPVRNMPAMATTTVMPETSTARPLVAAAIRSAVSASCPAARSSRSRRR